MDQPSLINDAFNGRYKASRQLGEGGFGQVFEATQIATGQLVAIKVLQLKQHRQIETQIARFQREMRLCAGLHHPHIVRLIDSGQIGEDVLCTVFEYVPGVTLAELLRKGGLDPREATHLMTQVLDALGCAHGAGIVHRDLKPHNIMITDTGVRRNAMVLDFGIGAIVEAAQLEELARLTKTNELLGTPAYAAPEQLRGQPPSTPSDLYSWGLVFLECLTGEQAIKADNLAELLARQSGPEPVPIPSWLRSHHLGRVLARVLVKDVQRRTADAAEIMRELERREIAGGDLEALASHRNLTPREGDALEPDTDTHTLLESFDIERHVLAGERRQVTALCCTLQISGLSTDLELRTYLGLIQAQQQVWSDVLRAHNGYFAGAMGDRFLFYFGYPLAKEDDALRAIRCGLALAETTRTRGEALRSELGLELAVSIGVHTDIVVTQMMSNTTIYSDVVGLTPVVAERIEAPPGEVVVSAATRHVLRDRFVFEPAGELRCNELREPVSLFRVVCERADTGEGDHEFVGRTHELSLLEHRWSLAARGEGQTILLSGEGGVGKSRLVRELHRRLPAESHRFLVCRCSPESRNSALQPIVELLELLLLPRIGTVEGSPSDGQRANALAGLLAELELEDDEGEIFVLLAGLLGVGLDPLRYPPLTLTPERQRELTANAVISVLLELSEQQPLLFVIEDLHWADPSTLVLIELLFEEVPTSSTCVILTTRPELEVPSSLEFMTQVQLSSLAKAEVAELLATLTGGAELPESLIRQISERADGIPLFVEELTQVLLNKASGAGGSNYSTSNFEIPATLRDALTARIDRLGANKSSIHVASALGREFSDKLFSEVASEFVEGDLDRHIAALCDAGLLTRKRRRGSVHYTFKHALLREVAHEAMLPADRRSIHGRIAATLERSFPKLVAKRPDLLAMHHRLAGQARQAVAYAQQAATSAMLRSANVEAGAHVRAALEWLPDLHDPRARAEAELDLNGIMTRVVMVTQGYGGVDMETLLRRSEELIAALGGSKQVFPNLAAFGVFHLVRGNMTAALEHAERLVKLGREADERGQEVFGLAFFSQCCFFQGLYARQREAAERANALFDPVAHRGHMFQYGQDSKVVLDAHMCSNLSITGELDAALEVADGARERARLLNIPHVSYGVLFGLACMFQYRDEREALIAISDEMRALAAAQGGSWYVMLVETQRAWAEGDADAVANFVGLLQGMGTGFASGYWGVMAADLEIAREQFDRALQLIDWALANVEDGSRFILPEMHRLKGRALAAMGEDRRDEAHACLAEALRVARKDGAKLFELRVALEQVRVTTALDENAHAMDTLRSVCGSFAEGRSHHELVAARALLDG